MPPLAIGIGGAIAGIGSGIAGAVASNNASKRASRTADAAAQRFYDVEDPNYEMMKLDPELLVQLGQISPELEDLIQQNPSAFEGLSTDPRLKNAELDALERLTRISESGGLDPQAQLAMEQARLQNASQARGARMANLSNAAQRGMSGSGLEFVSNQMADQNAANNNYLMGLQSASSANARDMDALGQLSSLSGTMQNREFGQKSQIAEAKDLINRMNTQMAADTQTRNVQSRNQAQAGNLAERQRVADQNVGLKNSAQQYNRSLEQQKFQNQMDRARGAAGLAPAQINAIQQGGESMSRAIGGIGQTAAGIGSSIYANSQPSSQDQYYKLLLAKEQNRSL